MKTLQLILLLALLCPVDGHTEIVCCMGVDGVPVYTEAPCPDGYVQMGITPFTVPTALPPAIKPELEPESEPAVEQVVKPAKASRIFRDRRGQLTMTFTDGLAHGQEWGYFTRRQWGIVPDTCDFYTTVYSRNRGYR